DSACGRERRACGRLLAVGIDQGDLAQGTGRQRGQSSDLAGGPASSGASPSPAGRQPGKNRGSSRITSGGGSRSEFDYPAILVAPGHTERSRPTFAKSVYGYHDGSGVSC